MLLYSERKGLPDLHPDRDVAARPVASGACICQVSRAEVMVSHDEIFCGCGKYGRVGGFCKDWPG